jgi:hypothetical protein
MEGYDCQEKTILGAGPGDFLMIRFQVIPDPYPHYYPILCGSSAFLFKSMGQVGVH